MALATHGRDHVDVHVICRCHGWLVHEKVVGCFTRDPQNI